MLPRCSANALLAHNMSTSSSSPKKIVALLQSKSGSRRRGAAVVSAYRARAGFSGRDVTARAAAELRQIAQCC